MLVIIDEAIIKFYTENKGASFVELSDKYKELTGHYLILAQYLFLKGIKHHAEETGVDIKAIPQMFYSSQILTPDQTPPVIPSQSAGQVTGCGSCGGGKVK